MELFFLVPLVLAGVLIAQSDDDDEPATSDVEGGEGADAVQGTNGADNLNGGGGDDLLLGLGGNDLLRGGDGDDLIDGGDGDDEIFGDDGNDGVTGGAGNDRIFLAGGDDITRVGDSWDDSGDDFIRGGSGNDILFDFGGSNVIFGDAGDDRISGFDQPGTDAPDEIFAGSGDDEILVDDGDTATGAAGVDLFTVLVDEADDAAATITDFDPASEQLVVLLDASLGSVDTSTLALRETDGDTEVLLDEQVVAVLAGATAVTQANLVLSIQELGTV